MNRQGSTGFTLTETLVVVSIIVLLLALLMPSLNGVRELGRTAACAANLHALGVAYQTRAYDQRTERPGAPAIHDPYAWPALLTPYLNDVEQTTCPSHATHALWDGDDPSAGDFDGSVSVPGYEVKFFIYGTGQTWFIPMSNESYMINSESWASQPGKWGSFYGTKPDQAACFTVNGWRWLDNPEVGTDYDFSKTEHQFSFVPDGNQLDAIAWKVNPTGAHNKWFVYNGEALPKGVGPGGGHGSRHRSPIPSNASYGMNNRVAHLNGENRVLLVDYDKLVANVVGEEAADAWGHEMQQVAGRHRGRVNALTSDGAVQAVWPSEIDPGLVDVHDKHWRPDRDPRLADAD